MSNALLFSFFTKNTFKYKNNFSLIGLIVKWERSKKKRKKLFIIGKKLIYRFLLKLGGFAYIVVFYSNLHLSIKNTRFQILN